ncbi:N-acetylmuramoyl-L-alanine amidase family protein [Chloroherpeton thalassium]|uniref:N-acetylmuramoyl-L-alanine amidase family protein n=1 Tax=Chloroherpeton thalassium TaxID=100716 RepID=UPI00145E04C9|nr:N-acetylmuramoyl-L-alanine amidase [Chloroherpeton thalassium]
MKNKIAAHAQPAFAEGVFSTGDCDKKQHNLALLTLFLFLTLLLLLPQNALAGETISVSVTLENKQVYTKKIALYSVGNLKMVAVSELCDALRLSNTQSLADLVVTAKPESQREFCTFRPLNHFAVIRSMEGSKPAHVLQLGVAPAMIGGTIYLPPAQVARLFSSWQGLKFEYNLVTKIFTADFSQKLSASIAKSPTPPSLSEKDEKESLTLDEQDKVDTRFTIPKFSIDEKANGAIIRIYCTRPEVEYEFIRPNKNGVAYLTFRNAVGDIKNLTQTFSTGLLKEVTAFALRSGGLQLTLNFNTKRYKIKSTECKRDEKSDDFLVHVLSDVDVSEIYKTEKEKEIKALLQEDRERWKLDVIALDAGHGGKDPGAIGYSGTYEKNVVLGVVMELGKLINQYWPDVKVVYTRKTDDFIELDERGRIANQQNAKLFVSVHCNASRNQRVSGVEVYMLGLHKTDAALRVAERENAVILQEDDYKDRYKDFTDENLIMITMAQSAFSYQSQKLADLINRNIQERTKQAGRGVKQAGFMVLWTPSMPSVLVEAGYITNPREERFLKSKEGQLRVARAIFEGLKKYRSDYEAQLKAR